MAARPDPIRHLRTAEDIMLDIRAALADGEYPAAQELAAKGCEEYPENAPLRKAAAVLAAPRVVNAHLPGEPGVADNQKWLRANADRFRGQWVALDNGTLLASAGSLRDLKRNTPLPDRVFITKIA